MFAYNMTGKDQKHRLSPRLRAAANGYAQKDGRAALLMLHCWVRLNTADEITMGRSSRGSRGVLRSADRWLLLVHTTFYRQGGGVFGPGDGDGEEGLTES